MWPILVQIGNYEIGTFGVLVGIGVLSGLWLARHLGERDGMDRKRVNDMGLLVLLSGFLGSKLLGVAVALISGASLNWGELRNAGAVHGGLGAAIICGFLLARAWKMPLPFILDAFVPAAALGQAIGRLGCLSAGCCFGTHSDLPWAVIFTDPRAAALGGVPLGEALHPVQLYDAGAHLLLLALLIVLHKKSILRGRIFGLWCILEGVIRFSVEAFRGDLGRGVWFDLQWLSTGRITALAFILLGALYLAIKRKSPEESVTTPSRSKDEL